MAKSEECQSCVTTDQLNLTVVLPPTAMVLKEVVPKYSLKLNKEN